MSPYHIVSLAVCVAAFIGLIVCWVWLLIDNKKFYEELDKQRYGWYNNNDNKQRRKPQ